MSPIVLSSEWCQNLSYIQLLLLFVTGRSCILTNVIPFHPLQAMSLTCGPVFVGLFTP